jgi:hypothetical protein
MAAKVNLQKSFAKLNENLQKQLDTSGVKRNFTVPYIDGQPTADHIKAVGAAAAQTGGLTGNLLTTAHHSEGRGWGTGDGHTVGYPGDKLRTTLIPKGDEHAKDTIEAAQAHLNNFKKLLGDDNPSVTTAQGQLDLVKKTDGAGMNLLDFGVLLSQIMFAPTQEIARAHSGTKDGGHGPQLRAPGSQEDPEAQEQPQDGSESQEAPEGQSEAQAAPAASNADQGVS